MAQDRHGIEDYLGVKSLDAAGTVLAMAGLNPGWILNGSTHVGLVFDHTAINVSMTIPGYIGKQIVQLDPSWKFRDFQTGLTGSVDILNHVSFNTNSSYFSAEQTESAAEWYEDQVSAYLKN